MEFRSEKPKSIFYSFIFCEPEFYPNSSRKRPCRSRKLCAIHVQSNRSCCHQHRNHNRWNSLCHGNGNDWSHGFDERIYRSLCCFGCSSFGQPHWQNFWCINMKFKPSRLLNEHTGLFNLNAFDVSAIGYFLVLSHTLLSRWGLELLSFLMSFVLFGSLVVIRMNFRKKTIRDFLKSSMWRFRL